MAASASPILGNVKCLSAPALLDGGSVLGPRLVRTGVDMGGSRSLVKSSNGGRIGRGTIGSGVPALTTSANKAASSQLPPPSCQLSFDGHGD